MQIQQSFKLQEEIGSLYLVPTPIGNLEDMTYRAVRVLQEVDLILAEDTRNSGVLLQHYQISTPMNSFHDHSDSQKVDRLVEGLQAGTAYALISDAGMPLINDPGHPLVQACIAQHIPVVALPGANAALTALIASGLAADRFTYYGFFPRKGSDQDQVLAEVGQGSGTAIFYESPHRIHKTVKKLQEQLAESTQLVLGRELTKKFETYIRGDVQSIERWLGDQTLKGELVLLIESGQAKQNEFEAINSLSLAEQVQQIIDSQACTPTQAIKKVAKLNQLSRNQVYAAYHQL
ncbi:16S rRNA (cytidine(1402)-2'-O)-methyltransferase [Ignavigranum ruoffiae]|uniref:Ribosomal RNA small subunit methyltransferase I n=1 Tax=Ignavigranum ruoffiae TaxID=89093 RepID=A0A1H9BK79_9LACT|nr:16S rRNA (cytidine(1402)-2'-O)-methyltransferase [Ignavigranum ruoffiae]SEP89147.1 16S rRNA (cytidine1402-2'-O)-methyltransferase [Ignavigranum ruoffiae]